MTTSMASNGASGFRLRPLGGGRGDRALDPVVAALLAELNAKLGKRCFEPLRRGDDGPGAAPAGVDGDASEQGDDGDEAAALEKVVDGAERRRAPRALDVAGTLALELRPRRTDRSGQGARAEHVGLPTGTWAERSLVRVLHEAPEHPSSRSLSDLIDAEPRLSDLRFALDVGLGEGWVAPGSAAAAVLGGGYGAIKDYLVAYAYLHRGVRDASGLRNVVVNKPFGTPTVADYAATSAARVVVERKKLTVRGIDDDRSSIVTRIADADLPLFDGAFAAGLEDLVRDAVFDADYNAIIDAAEPKIGRVPPDVRLRLVEYIKRSPVPITKGNASYYLPLFISQITGGVDVEGSTAAADPDRDFAVQFLPVDDARAAVSASAVRCAAQLYYAMVLGDELGIFRAVDHLTHSRLLQGGFDIEDPRLREDLQNYVFSQRFTTTDPRTNQRRTLDRTRPAERAMFQRQVFGMGREPAADGMVLNDDFGRLWKILMLEAATYLQRAQASPNPESYVSGQNVVQAVEDLQYNLSAHTTGMATVITPLVYAELTFVTRRILMHDEVVRQVAPGGGSWWKVVEALAVAQDGRRPRATVLNKKAQLGHDILRAVADYDPATFGSDRVFSGFISTVDAFITTQSILQESLTDDLVRSDTAAGTSGPAGPAAPAEPTRTDAAEDDEWAF